MATLWHNTDQATRFCFYIFLSAMQPAVQEYYYNYGNWGEKQRDVLSLE